MAISCFARDIYQGGSRKDLSVGVAQLGEESSKSDGATSTCDDGETSSTTTASTTLVTTLAEKSHKGQQESPTSEPDEPATHVSTQLAKST